MKRPESSSEATPQHLGAGKHKADERVAEGESRIISSGSSMELLNRIAAGSLDPGYREYRKRGNAKESPLMNAWILLVCVVFAFAATLAVKGMRQESLDSDSPTSQLAKQVEEKSTRVEELEGQVEALQQTKDDPEPSGGSVGDGDPAVETGASSTRVEGPGLVVTLTESVTTGTLATVSDADIRTVVNALWAGGAEAIAINGERLGPQSVVRTAGQSILVNLKTLKSPYVIEAIGDAAALQDSLNSSAPVQALKSKSGMSLSTGDPERLILGSVPTTQLWYVTGEDDGG